MPQRKRHPSEDEQIRELHEHAELIRRKSAELVRRTDQLAAEVAKQTERVQNEPGPVARKPR